MPIEQLLVFKGTVASKVMVLESHNTPKTQKNVGFRTKIYRVLNEILIEY